MINYSIIIPHYNIPDLLVRCLRSIPRRDDVQVIVVDDGSPDAEKYTELYPELTAPGVEFHPVAHQGLAGVMRNIGLGYAKGRWVTFLDADDLLSENAGSLFDRSAGLKADIVYHKVVSVLSEDLTAKACRYTYDAFFDEYAECGETSGLRYLFYPLWGKLFDREFLQQYHIQCQATKYSNDVLFSVTAGYYAKFVEVVDEVLYVVTQREDSLAAEVSRGKVPSLEECRIRLDVAICERSFLESHEVVVSDAHVRRYLSEMRAHYKEEYFRQVMKLLFTHPSYYFDSFFLKDIRYVGRSLFSRRSE